MSLLQFLRGIATVEVTMAIIQVCMVILLGVMIAIIFFTIRGLVMYYFPRYLGKKK